MSKWHMDNNEISVMFRTSKNKKKQVTILAELNLKTQNEVLDKLVEIGAIHKSDVLYQEMYQNQKDENNSEREKSTYLKKPHKRWTKENDDSLVKMANEGESGNQISKAYGLARRTINWRRKMLGVPGKHGGQNRK